VFNEERWFYCTLLYSPTQLNLLFTRVYPASQLQLYVPLALSHFCSHPPFMSLHSSTSIKKTQCQYVYYTFYLSISNICITLNHAQEKKSMSDTHHELEKCFGKLTHTVVVTTTKHPSWSTVTCKGAQCVGADTVFYVTGAIPICALIHV
jgi:hypothetical protein